MHALHSLAHRAPPATRTRVRWQPYTSLPASSYSSSSSRSSPPSSYLNTPTSSVTSSPQSASSTYEIDHIRQILPSATPLLKEPPPRDTNRHKHAVSLVGEHPVVCLASTAYVLSADKRVLQDQAVKSLGEIWRPQDIPPVFVASAHTMVTGGATYELNPLVKQKLTSRSRNHNTQLPSPVSPSTQPSPSLTTSSSSPFTHAQALPLLEQDVANISGSRGNLVPIKAFVHEVLRRSRTSGCVLQTALCYLEAIRSKVPELIRQEHAGEGVKGEPNLGDLITPATEAELEREMEFAMSLDPVSADTHTDDDVMATVRVYDNGLENSLRNLANHSQADDMPAVQANQRLPPSPSLPALPPLPSPLLCPRRAFLASLILASKFTQDKCYSNRAWAKLSGLPPREIGRCERALGEALEWRLWVGKQPAAPQTSSPLPIAPANRPVVRSRSESSLFTTTPEPFLTQDEKSDKPLPTCHNSMNRGLRRCATLPAETYVPSIPLAAHLDQAPWRTSKLSTSNLNDKDMQSPDQMTTIEQHATKPIDLCPSTSMYFQHVEHLSLSPSPQTPGLSYSPSSTDSCSGDRTIQMSSFLDDSMATFTSSNPAISNSDSWPWLDTYDAVPCLPTAQSTPCRYPNAAPKMNPILDHFGLTPLVTGYAGSVPRKVPPGADAIGCSWATENGILMCSLPS